MGKGTHSESNLTVNLSLLNNSLNDSTSQIPVAVASEGLKRHLPKGEGQAVPPTHHSLHSRQGKG